MSQDRPAARHPLTRLCLEFLDWRARFDGDTSIAPDGATYAEILASLDPSDGATAAELAARHGEPWVERNWSRLRVQVLYIRSL